MKNPSVLQHWTATFGVVKLEVYGPMVAKSADKVLIWLHLELAVNWIGHAWPIDFISSVFLPFIEDIWFHFAKLQGQVPRLLNCQRCKSILIYIYIYINYTVSSCELWSLMYSLLPMFCSSNLYLTTTSCVLISYMWFCTGCIIFWLLALLL